MAPVFIYRHYKTLDAEVRQKAISALTTDFLSSFEMDPEVLKFVIGVERESEHDELSVIIIEEYASETALNKHQPTFHTFHNNHPGLISAPPIIRGPFYPTASYTRPSIHQVSNPYIILANFGYKPTTTSTAVIGWNELVSTVEKSEPGTLTYAILEDDKDDFIRTVEAYESMEYCRDIHMKGDAIVANGKQNGELRTGVRETFRMRMVGGFWFRE